MNKKVWIIKDWIGNVCFRGKEFDSFDDAEDFLCETLGDDYEEDRGEYYAITIDTNKFRATTFEDYYKGSGDPYWDK